ncbi:MAG TPA: DNA replication and repair protein RecF [Solirubrobacterales bacterium]|nr:DNA replication and repair protein RecF [Solirubrobacterales bacterium]
MVVDAIECRGFRNLADARTELGGGIVVVCGPNGAGKTNLLEAVYFGLTARSFRSGVDRDMIRFDDSESRVELELSGGGGHLLAAIARSGERRHLLGEKPLAGEPSERPLVSVFHPDRLQLLKGAPARRRAHIDRLCGALWPGRADLRQRFGRTLAQRNALVSRIRAGLGGGQSLSSWDGRLASEAEPLIEARAAAVERLAEPFARLGSLLGLGEAAEISYRPRAPRDRRELAAELERRRTVDLGRAYTSYGPQLDEIEIGLSGRPLRRFGSQGQQRLGLLALLLAERSALLDAGRTAPLMLLDDVMSELDPEHRVLLVELLADAGQTMITATEPAHVPAPIVTRISVDAGTISRPAALRAA